LLQKNTQSRNTCNKIGSPKFLWKQLLEIRTCKNIQEGTLFLKVVSRGT
jgi:hypothetical protein